MVLHSKPLKEFLTLEQMQDQNDDSFTNFTHAVQIRFPNGQTPAATGNPRP